MGVARLDPALKLDYIAQIKRDMAVLKEDPIYFHVPGRRFYERRIEAYRHAILHMDSSPAGASGGNTTKRSNPRVWVRLKRKR